MLSYNDLPGVKLEIKDGNITLPAEPSVSGTVLIIAPITETGSSEAYEDSEYNPVTISGQADFEEKGFGVFKTTNPMAKLWKQVYDAGCRNIKVVELKGTTDVERYGHLHDILSLLEESSAADIVLLGGAYADSEVEGSPTFAYDSVDYAAAIEATNTRTKEVAAEAIAAEDDEKTFTLAHFPVVSTAGYFAVTSTVGNETTTLVSGTDYTFNPITGQITFEDVPEETAGIKVSYSYYTYSFASALAGFCETVSAKNQQVLGVCSLAPAENSNLSTIKAYVEGQETQLYSKYLQVTGGSTMWFSLGTDMYEDIWSGAYAGFVSVLPSYSSPMFKAIPGALISSYTLSPTQITSLINKHIVVPRIRNGRIIVADAITTASDTSDFVRLTTLRIVNDAVQFVREIAEPYIGEPNTIPRRNSLDTAIRSGLQQMVLRGALNDFRFHIRSSIADQIDGTMRILLDLVPVFETRRILLSVAAKPML